MHVAGVGSTRREGLDNWKYLQVRPSVTAHRLWSIDQLRQNGRVTPMRDSRSPKSQAQGVALSIGKFGESQIDCGQSQKSGIALCFSN
jgi:hypothetical protein